MFVFLVFVFLVFVFLMFVFLMFVFLMFIFLMFILIVFIVFVFIVFRRVKTKERDVQYAFCINDLCSVSCGINEPKDKDELQNEKEGKTMKIENKNNTLKFNSKKFENLRSVSSKMSSKTTIIEKTTQYVNQ
jgi:Ca2+/Na+ antiporter